MRWPTMRAMMSLGPPAGNGTISLIGFAGKSCAAASAGKSESVNTVSSLRRIFIRTSLFQQFAGLDDFDGALREEVAPDPIVMTNDAGGVEVRAIAQSVAVRDGYDVVMMCDHRSNCGVDAKISRPAGYKNPVRMDFGQARLQVGPGKRVIQCRWESNVFRLLVELRNKLPSGRVQFKVVTLGTAVLDQNDFAGFGADLGGEPVDA